MDFINSVIELRINSIPYHGPNPSLMWKNAIIILHGQFKLCKFLYVCTK